MTKDKTTKVAKTTKATRTRKVELTIKELECAYVACSSYTISEKPIIKARLVNKLREALLNAVLNR